MKAVRIHAYGGPEALCYDDAPRPEPGRGELLVRVKAAGVNPVDWKIREGRLRTRLNHALPLILGWDVAGVVEQIGPEVETWRVRDAIYSRPDIARDGAYAEWMVVRASEAGPKPKRLDWIHAAAAPLAGLTAWQSLFDVAQLRRGQTVLIHGAAGGVGHIAVQLAKWRGARVIGTASEGNHGFLEQLGADEVIDYQAVRFEEAVQDVDVVLDTIGGETQERSWKVLKKGGRLVSIAQPPSREAAAAQGVHGDYFFIEPNAAELRELAALIDKGRIKPSVEMILPLAEARQAHELSQSGHTRGKIVLNVDA